MFANDWDKLSIKGTVHRSVNDSGDLFVKSAGDDPRINFPLLSFKANTRYLIDIQMTSSVESRLQIYYTESTQKTRALSEKNSLRFPVKKGENTVHAFIGVNNLGRVMRLDPIATAGEVTIKRLKIIALD
ncbi:hypothetical protein [sulfur-oxidizing endosymbiont of Gigantopelta aegis]|uniref:hypothetical protein n=1 Tax=sulfur-oxidizing endosymbiont of Gigantopelta aegis TaxID=2794934 RepID=UPI0018DC9CFA|nr:hypothetical protein [sulfur-oxidizing endosymbiont of Gigantopelta aegis]